jgi:hypothetical protein
VETVQHQRISFTKTLKLTGQAEVKAQVSAPKARNIGRAAAI